MRPSGFFLIMHPRLRELWPDEGWKQFVFVLSIVLFLLCVWLFIEIAEDAPEGDFLELEHRILLAFRAPDNPANGLGPWWVPEMARDVTALGSAFVLTTVTLAMSGFLILRGRLRTATLIIAATAGGAMLSSMLKETFARGRPTIVPHLVEEVSMSFPSGHSMVGSAFYLTLGVLLAQTVARRTEKLYCITIAILMSLMIGISRVYLGVHYPTDVIAGWAAGTAWALFCWGAACWLQQHGALRTPEQAEEAAHAS